MERTPQKLAKGQDVCENVKLQKHYNTLRHHLVVLLLDLYVLNLCRVLGVGVHTIESHFFFLITHFQHSIAQGHLLPLPFAENKFKVVEGGEIMVGWSKWAEVLLLLLLCGQPWNLVSYVTMSAP